MFVFLGEEQGRNRGRNGGRNRGPEIAITMVQAPGASPGYGCKQDLVYAYIQYLAFLSRSVCCQALYPDL